MEIFSSSLRLSLSNLVNFIAKNDAKCKFGFLFNKLSVLMVDIKDNLDIVYAAIFIMCICEYYSDIHLTINGPLARYIKLRVAHAPGMSGTFFSRHLGLAIPTCITTRASRRCRDACRDR